MSYMQLVHKVKEIIIKKKNTNMPIKFKSFVKKSTRFNLIYNVYKNKTTHNAQLYFFHYCLQHSMNFV